jgi:transketolase
MTDLKFHPNILRKTILDMSYAGKTVHIPCAFSIVEILASLYRSHLNAGDYPGDPERDYLVLSKGHGVMALYACLYEKGWLKAEDIKNYFKDGTTLKGLSDCHTEGVEVTSGSLGHGLSVGVGIALGLKFKGSKQRVFAIVGDGECNEGAIWEALLFATHWKLDNLVVIVDANGYQAMGKTEDVMSLKDLPRKFEAFNLETYEVDGHDASHLDEVFRQIKTRSSEKPKAIVANTVKGHGVSFMAGNNTWHYTRLTETTYKAALAELGF